MNIFVAKLNFRTTSEELRALFEQFGTVNSAKVIVDHETGRSKGYGFVEMAHDDQAQEAINTLNEQEFHERTIIVKKALPQEKRSFQGNGGGHQGGGHFNRPPRYNQGGGYHNNRY